jgi:hypothetical protein
MIEYFLRIEPSSLELRRLRARLHREPRPIHLDNLPELL